jgi:hypothetical protein
MATIDLGRIKFKWQGAWSSSTAYVVDDVVESGGNAYVCIAASTNNEPPNATYWELMAQKGTDTSVATTQGDIIYHNGTSLARLGAGTSGQYLETQGSGANPQWSTVSSDWVKLHTVNHSGSNVTSYSFDGYFDDTVYGSYKYIGIHRMASGQSGTNAHSIIRYNVNGAEKTNADYNYAWNSGYYNGSAGSQQRGNSNQSYVPLFNTWNESLSQNTVMNLELTIYNPQNTDSIHSLTEFKTSMSWTSNEIASGHGAMNHEGTNTSSTTKITGFTFKYLNGENFNLAQGTLYGLKK